MFDSKSRIRVAFVMHKMQVAGAEVLVKRIIESLSDLVEATVICLDDVGELGQQLISVGTTVVNLNRQPGFNWQVARDLAAELNSRNIEVIHAHQYTPFFYSALARMRYRVNSKIIFTEHGRHYPDIVSRKRRFVNQWLLRRYSDVTTACCDFSTEALRQKDRFPNAFTLRNGVDINKFAAKRSEGNMRLLRKRLGLKPDANYVGCVARMHAIKDHATLIRGWELVQRNLPDARLLLIGDGEERERLEKQVAQAGLGQSVEFWGIRNDVSDILSAIDVFALTSISEAASLTLLEAMASGCASVVTDVGGNAEHLRDGVDGFLVPRGDALGVGSSISKLLLNKDLRAKFGAAARQNVSDRFSLDTAVASYASHYQKLANRTPEKIHREPPVIINSDFMSSFRQFSTNAKQVGSGT